MAKWDVELSYGIGFTVQGVDAGTREEAIEKAKHLVEEHTDITTGRQVDAGCMEFENVTHVQMEGVTWN